MKCPPLRHPCLPKIYHGNPAIAYLQVQRTLQKQASFLQLFKIRVNPMYSSSPYISTILITHQILNIIQGGVVQHVPMPASHPAQPEPASPKPRGARATQKIVDDSDYKRICLCSSLCSWNSSIISDSIHLISYRPLFILG